MTIFTIINKMADFIDTNILLYSISNSPNETSKRRIALGILENEDCVLSVQVLGEFYLRATKPKERNQHNKISEDDATSLIKSWLRFRTQIFTVDIVERAMKISKENKIGYWDSALVAAAEVANCNRFLSEDLNHLQKIGNVSIVNPFEDRI